MKKFDVSRSMKTVKSVITANSPVLLLGASIAGVVATGVLAAKAGYKARGIVDEAQAEKGSEPLTTQEKVSLTWLCYAAPAITGVSTIASCTGIHLIHSKRNAMLAGLYAVTAGKLDDYKEEAEKLLGVKKSQQLTDTLSQKDADGSPIGVNNEIIINGAGTELCHDRMTGRWFMSSITQIDAAINEANGVLVDEGELTMNELYDRLGLPDVPFGMDLGWKRPETKKIGVNYGNVTSPDNRPAISITFHPAPKPQ